MLNSPRYKDLAKYILKGGKNDRPEGSSRKFFETTQQLSQLERRGLWERQLATGLYHMIECSLPTQGLELSLLQGAFIAYICIPLAENNMER
jgi:hypothetical protein